MKESGTPPMLARWDETGAAPSGDCPADCPAGDCKNTLRTWRVVMTLRHKEYSKRTRQVP